VARTPEALLAAMTWREKLEQLQIVWKPRTEDAHELARRGIGCLFWPGGARATNDLQRVAVEESRLGIPLLIGLDVVHGQFTIFPTPLAQAASFDPAVAEADARTSAAEARSAGVTWTFSPMVDVSRDPRWGRVVEGFGEDPYLTARFGRAKACAYQGRSLADPTSVLACLKHYVGYGMAEGGRDYNTADASEYRLRNVYLEPFRQAVAAGAASVMASFNTMSGVPMHANTYLLTDVLKHEWGHAGIVVGDADGVGQLVQHGVARDAADAVRLALGAGLDVEMGGSVTGDDGEPVVGPDDLDVARVDDAVLRVLRLKTALGLFENPYVDEALEATAPTAETRAAARWAAERSIVLLKNDDRLLPVPDDGRRILLVGPYATSTDHLGAWVQHFAAEAGTVGDALAAALPSARITTLPGAGFLTADPDLRAEARAAAADADLVVVAVGEPSDLSGEARSRSDIRLPGDQELLVHAIADSGVPFAVVLFNGRPLDVSRWIDRAPAVLEAWHLGVEAPAAIAAVLTGAVNPGGRLPMAFPRAVGQVPVHHDHESTGRPARTGGSLDFGSADVVLLGPGNTDDFYTSKYLDLELGPQFEFGHGLSYTRFELGTPRIDEPELAVADLAAGKRVNVAVPVRNVGDRFGDDVVQLYVRDLVASLAPPVRRLRGFQRVGLQPGEEKLLEFSLSFDDLGFWTNEPGGRFVVEPGDFTVTVSDGVQARDLPLRVT
jgi:beta-glucosidase